MTASFWLLWLRIECWSQIETLPRRILRGKAMPWSRTVFDRHGSQKQSLLQNLPEVTIPGPQLQQCFLSAVSYLDNKSRGGSQGMCSIYCLSLNKKTALLQIPKVPVVKTCLDSVSNRQAFEMGPGLSLDAFPCSHTRLW